MNADPRAAGEPGAGSPTGGDAQAIAASAAGTQATAVKAAPGQLSRSGWIALWAAAIVGVVVVFVIVVAITNP